MKPNKSFLSQPPARGTAREPGPGPKDAPAPAQDLRHRLELPPTHSLYKLWALCRNQKASLRNRHLAEWRFLRFTMIVTVNTPK